MSLREIENKERKITWRFNLIASGVIIATAVIVFLLSIFYWSRHFFKQGITISAVIFLYGLVRLGLYLKLRKK
ncbi:MAG: hypothetical protein AB1393_13815 [Candidatus Edwardsbacteria bacterium]